MTAYLPHLSILGLLISAYVLLWSRSTIAELSGHREILRERLHEAEHALADYRAQEQRRAEKLSEWGRRGAEATNAKRGAK